MGRRKLQIQGRKMRLKNTISEVDLKNGDSKNYVFENLSKQHDNISTEVQICEQRIKKLKKELEDV